MAIQKKPRTDAVESFIQGAPDAQTAAPTKGTYNKGIPKGRKRQISLTISPDLLRAVDERAEKAGIGRAAFISMAIYKALENN